MDGLTLLDEARAAGLEVAVKGDKLVVRGPRWAESIARKLLISKREAMTALVARPTVEALAAADSTEAADWREFYAERAAVRQYDGRWPRDLAERLAYAECVEEWCKRHPEARAPMACVGCGRSLASEILDLPDGARPRAAARLYDQRILCNLRYPSLACRALERCTQAGGAAGLSSGGL